MAILNEITVGDTLWQEVDSVPIHSAPKGSKAILSTGNLPTVFSNISGSTTWARTRQMSYGSMFYTGNTIASNGTQNSWINNDVRTHTGGLMKDFTLVTSNHLTLDSGKPTSVYLVTGSTTTVGASSKSYDVQLSPALNNTAPGTLQYHGTGTRNSIEANMNITKFFVMSGSDYVNCGHRWVNNYGGGPQNGYILRDINIWVERVYDYLEDTVFESGFETGDFTGWTTVNGAQTNQWVVSTVDVDTGTYSAHISPDGGTTNTYTITAASVVHFYRDITFPAAGKAFNISFNWKCTGENGAGDDQYDYGRVFLSTTGTTPVAGTQVNVADSIGLIKYNSQGTYTTANISLPASLAGTTRRLIFSWNNDATVGTSPGFTIDNIKLTSLS